MNNIKEVQEARKALKCLRLEVPGDIAADIERRVEKAFKVLSSPAKQFSGPQKLKI